MGLDLFLLSPLSYGSRFLYIYVAVNLLVLVSHKLKPISAICDFTTVHFSCDVYRTIVSVIAYYY